MSKTNREKARDIAEEFVGDIEKQRMIFLTYGGAADRLLERLERADLIKFTDEIEVDGSDLAADIEGAEDVRG